jgi:ribosome biogenesis GTPase / thiamine phosphate phosphatase
MSDLYTFQRNARAHDKKERAKAQAKLSVPEVEADVSGTLVAADAMRTPTGETVAVNNEIGAVVGDSLTLGAKNEVVSVAPRQGVIARYRRDSTRHGVVAHKQVLAANIDIAVIVASTVRPDFHPRLVDRFLIVCQDGGVKPVLCLTKTDLGSLPDLEAYRTLGMPVIPVSSITGEGVAELREALRGVTSVLIGASGAGKSSLANALFGSAVARTGETGKKTGRGRHTTTSGAMYEWDAGSFVIDTPGIRSLGVENIDRDELQWYFPEFDAYRAECKFSNCEHAHEPGCAVAAAAASGDINPERYASYVRLWHNKE